MPDVPTFSVLLPTKDRLHLAKGAIETVRRQSVDDWELILADNCSNDDVAGYVASLGDPRIRHLRSEQPLSVTDNWNRCIDAARGRWMVMLGDDDGLTPGYLARMTRLIGDFPDAELLYTGAWHFVFPGAVPGVPEGRLTEATGRAAFLRGLNGPRFLDRATAEAAARAALGMRMVYNFNMQYFLFSAAFIGRLRAFGPVFQGPFPDFYTANLSLLLADRILAVPEPLVTIGISRSSFGFYHYNDREKSGVDFLSIAPHLRDAPEGVRTRLLPGTKMNTSWLVSVELARQKLAGVMPLSVDVGRYRLMQVFDAVRRAAEGLPAEARLAEQWPRLDLRERVFALAALLALLPARVPIKALRHGWVPLLRRIAGGRAPEPPPPLPMDRPLHDMVDVYEALAARAGQQVLNQQNSVSRLEPH
jgi:glycosyltransferase involved in cell wall biosynthesis